MVFDRSSLSRSHGPGAARRGLLRRHLAAVLIEELRDRLVEPLVERPAAVAGDRPETAERGLGLTHVLGHRAPLALLTGAAADRVRGERLAQHVGKRL